MSHALPKGGHVLLPNTSHSIPGGGHARKLVTGQRIVYPESDADLQSMTKLAQSAGGLWLYRGGTNTFPDLIGASNMAVAAGSVTHVSDDSTLGIDCIETAESSTAEVSAADIFDSDLATSIVIGGVCAFPAAPGANTSLFGKGPGAGPFYEVRVNADGSLNVTVYDGSVSGQVAIASFAGYDGRAVHLALKINRTADTLDLFTSLGDGAQAGIATVGDLSNTDPLDAIGGRLASPHVRMSMMFAYSGAAAEAFTSTHLANLRTAQGF